MSSTLLQNNVIPEDIEMEETHDDMNKIEPAATDYIPDTNRCLMELYQIMRDAADTTESLAKMQACKAEQLCSAFKDGLSFSSDEHKNTT